MSLFSKFRRSAKDDKSEFDQLIEDAVEQARAGNLEITKASAQGVGTRGTDAAAEAAAPEQKDENEQEVLPPETVAEDGAAAGGEGGSVRDIQAALNENFSVEEQTSGPATIEADEVEASDEAPAPEPVEAKPPTDKDIDAMSDTPVEEGSEAIETEDVAPLTDQAISVETATSGGSEVGPAGRKISRAERDMRAMKEAPDLKGMVRKEVVAGSIAVAVFMSFLFAWSAMAPLSSAAIAPGVISPYGSRKTVQHLEGGIIDKILVREGDEVAAGDPLVLLKDTMAQASYGLIRTQYYTLAARHARLGALQTGEESVQFPGWLAKEAGDPEVAAILASEANLLQTRRRAHQDRKAVLRQRIAQLDNEITGLRAQIEGQTRQISLIGKEIKGVQELVDKGLERTPRLLGLQRTEAEIKAQRGANTARIAKTEQAIGETELELIAADTVLQDEIAREMAQVQTELSQAGERMAASGDILNRVEIVAPVAGKIIGLNYHTAGGIIAPGASILDIVPENEELIIEARVSPMDIDVVYENLAAQIHLSAFAQRNLPMIKGTVRSVSADRLIDEVTGQPYFRATVEVAREEIAKIGEGVALSAGMPAEVMIVTGEQTLLGYLFQPIADTLRRSFREG